jgi:signal recognition particle receptor subunit beta
MRIVEIGHSGVGKTTFMASMYSTMQTDIEGFKLRATQSSDHTRLVKLSHSIHHGNYPTPTDQRSEYSFYLQYQGKDIFPFIWADYRGGAIRETKDSQQAKLLQQDLKQADGILMFCDCEALVKRDTRRNQISRMTSLITHALGDLDHPIALVVILTKADLVDGIDDEDLKPLEGLAQALQASELIASTLVPVACGPEPQNVAIPLLFSLYFGVSLQVRHLAQEIETHKSLADHYTQKTHGVGGFLRETWDSLAGNPTYRDMANSKINQVVAKYKELEVLIEPVTKLEKYFSSEDED